MPESILDRERAEQIASTGWWKTYPPLTVVLFQLWEDRLCMDFGDFQEALEKVVGRPVFTTEMAYNRTGLKREVIKAMVYGRVAQ